MLSAIPQMGLGPKETSGWRKRPTGLVVATDGTDQSDSAVLLARMLWDGGEHDVTVVTVIEDSPAPWGSVDRNLVIEYKLALNTEAQIRAEAQLRRLGISDWSLDVLSGEPAKAIAEKARTSRPKMVLTGLGNHGVAAKFFGNETALRLIRIAETPVLAVHSSLKGLPKRIMVAMDFREASIEAARLALDIAAPGATIELVHVVPWERREFVPEQWFRDYEAQVTAQLTRVTGWLDRGSEYRIHQTILYGKPGPALTACAEALDADLIVAGTHGRGFVARALGGETVAKLVRGAHRSILVLPEAAAFQQFHVPAETGERRDEHEEWTSKLDGFSRRNLSRRGRLEVDDHELGAQVEMTGYRFLGATYDPPSERVQLMFGELEGGGPHLVRGISNIRSVDILSAPGSDDDSALSIVSDDGQTILLFERKWEGS